jgi:hypothetical protein
MPPQLSKIWTASQPAATWASRNEAQVRASLSSSLWAAAGLPYSSF